MLGGLVARDFRVLFFGKDMEVCRFSNFWSWNVLWSFAVINDKVLNFSRAVGSKIE